MTKIVFKLSALASLACMASFGLIFGVIAVLYGYDDYEETEVTTVETEIQEAENTEIYVSVECDLPVVSTSDSASVALNYATVWEVETDTVTSGESTLTAQMDRRMWLTTWDLQLLKKIIIACSISFMPKQTIRATRE